MLVYYAITPNSVFKSLPPNGSEPTSQRSMLYSDIVPLIYVNETICMVICPSIRFKSMVSMARDESLGVKIIPKYILWMTGLLPFWVLRLSFLSLTDCSVQFSSVPQSCLTLCDPMDCSPPGSSTHGIFQARVQSVNERKECLKTQNGTRPLIHKMYFGIILAAEESSWAIKP